MSHDYTPEQLKAAEELTECIQKLQAVLAPDNSDAEEMEIPEGPWMVSGWVLGVEWVPLSEGTMPWATMLSSPKLPLSSKIGLSMLLADRARGIGD